MPKMIEVDEESYLRSEKLRSTLASWMNNPASKRKLLEAHKAFDPKAEIPELDQPDPVQAALKPTLDRMEVLEKQLADERSEREKREKLDAFTGKIEKSFDKLRREEGLTPAGEEGVRKLMEEEGISNPEIAWSHFQKLHPPAAPVMPGGTGSWNFMEPPPDDAKDIKALIDNRGENEQVADRMARDILADIRGAVRR